MSGVFSQFSLNLFRSCAMVTCCIANNEKKKNNTLSRVPLVLVDRTFCYIDGCALQKLYNDRSVFRKYFVHPFQRSQCVFLHTQQSLILTHFNQQMVLADIIEVSHSKSCACVLHITIDAPCMHGQASGNYTKTCADF